jgi:hypothetical protein
VVGGEAADKYLILRNGTTLIGLFEQMFDDNILTFNPGLAQDTSEVNPFTDVRTIQAHLEEAGVELTETVDSSTSGPGHVTFVDPDGNHILIDQFR